MTRAERAEIAFRIAGLALAVRGVCLAVETLRVQWGEFPVCLLVSHSLLAAAGGLVFCLPRRLSRLLVRPATSAHDKAAQHALQVGIVLIALAWLLRSLAAALACTVTPQPAGAFGIRSSSIVHGMLALAVCLSVMRGQRGLARFLGRRIGSEARMATGAVLVAGVGLALLALRATAPAGVSIVANALIWWPYVGAGGWLMAGIPAAQIALAVALLAFLLPLARWATGGTGQDAGALPDGLNRRTFLEIAILICAACLLSVSTAKMNAA